MSKDPWDNDKTRARVWVDIMSEGANRYIEVPDHPRDINSNSMNKEETEITKKTTIINLSLWEKLKRFFR